MTYSIISRVQPEDASAETVSSHGRPSVSR
jgi:hypothetical protein